MTILKYELAFFSSDKSTGNMTEIAGQFQNLSEMTKRPTLFVKTETFMKHVHTETFMKHVHTETFMKYVHTETFMKHEHNHFGFFFRLKFSSRSQLDSI